MHRDSRRNVLVALCTYNEIDTLPLLVERVREELPDAEILVVDDNSPDGTGAWCEQCSTRDPQFHAIHRSGKLGLGSATIEAMRYAINAKCDVIVTLDADLSHDPKHIPELLQLTNACDVAIGSRYCPGGKIEGWPISRRIISRILNQISRRLLNLPVRDASGAFRAYRIAKLEQLDLAEIREQGYGYLEEILWHLRRHHATFGEVPITFRDRSLGQSKADWREARGKLKVLWRLARA